MKYSLRSVMTFSIRDLVWLTVVVALGVGWWIERTRAERLAKEAEVTDATEAIILRHVKKVEEENAQLWSKFAEMPSSSAPAPIPPKK
jgi:hypothetical protein